MESQPPAHQIRSAGGGGGGGKILTNRRRARFNPYERPPQAAAPPPKSPNFLSGILVPASRRIAYGAAKIFSSVFISDSSESDSSDQDSVSEDYVNCENGRDDHQNETNGSNLEAVNSPQGCTSKELGVGVEETGRKHVVKQLISQETFSREECDELVKIINSGVLEHSTVDWGTMVDSDLIPGSSVLNVTPEHAVMEARKFLEEKKAGRSLETEFGSGSSRLYSAMIQHIDEEAAESPADMAKSYMRARPPWASPSTENFELRTPSTLLTQLTSEEKLHSVCKNSVSRLKGKNYLASGAWNMQYELRRVRSKATEDMLRPLSSSKVDLSLLSSLSRSSQDYGVAVAIPEDRVNTLSKSVETKTVDQSAKLAAGGSSNRGISASDIKEAVVIEASLADQATLDPEGEQDLEANWNGSELAVSDHSVIPESPDHAAEYADINFICRNGCNGAEVKALALPQRSETQKANGVSSSPASSSTGGTMGEDQRHSIEDNVAMSREKLTNDFPVELRCVLLTEASIEVPINDATNGENGSRNSRDELSDGQTETEGKNSVGGTGKKLQLQGKRPIRRQPKRQKL